MNITSKRYLTKLLFRWTVREYSTIPGHSNLVNVLLNMPRERNHVDVMRQQRIKLNEKRKKCLPGILYLQVLGSGAEGSPRSLYLFTDHTKYLFNCSEGTQRQALEHKSKIAKLEHIFITRPTWENIGGLPGMALSAQDAGVRHFTLHGPPGVKEIFEATKKFVILRSLGITEFDCDSNTFFEDSIMTVRYVRLVKSDAGKEESDSENSIEITDDETDYYAHEINRNGKRFIAVDKTPQKPKKIGSDNSPVKRISEAMAFICKLNTRPGTLSLEKCVEKGVPPGPLLGQLKDGINVTLPNGTIVLSSEVMMPETPGAVLIVLECPTVDYLDSLVESKSFDNYQCTATTDDNLAYCVVHFTPENVMADPRYSDWMNKFGASTIHLVLNEQNDCIGSDAIHRRQHRMNLIHPKIFPLLSEMASLKENQKGYEIVEGKEDELVEKLMAEASQSRVESDQQNVVIHAKTMHKVHLRPRKGFDQMSELKLQPEDYTREIVNDREFSDVLSKLQTQIAAKMEEIGDVPEYPKFVFLGTGSCAPNKTRNTSGILFRVNETDSMVFDCGEGTLTQISRFYGKKKAPEILESIKAIYVSHLHADHHMGLIGLLKARGRVTKDRVFVLAPKQISSWLSLYHKKFEPILDKFTLIPNDDLNFENHKKSSIDKQINLFANLGAKDISTVRVNHVPNSFGVSVTLADGFKVTYSGDTMPSNNLVKLGRNSDLLIHEATMEDELENEARLKLHSTTSQAIDIGKRMEAKFTLLTHFSQRYAKLPRLSEEAERMVGVAFDNMEVRIGELTLLPLLYPAFRVMFADACEELEHRATKRKQRLERS